MIDTQAIRSKILDLAMRGQLTEQLPEDSNAEELYQQILEEKQKLIKDGKIKKQKPLPEISNEEIPFDIPANWKWVRLSDLVYLTSGNQYEEVLNGLQNKVNTIEIKLKEFELKEKEEQQQKKACVEARVNHISQNKYKIKIWNSGNSIAKNVSASWNNTKGIILFDNDKMPFEFLEPQKGFDLSISTYNGAPRKMCTQSI